MDPVERGHRIRMLDEFRRDFEQANTRLTVCGFALRNNDATQAQFSSFIQAALDVKAVCERPYALHNPLDVLFWLKQKLEDFSQQSERPEVIRASCRRELRLTEERIQNICDEVGEGKVMALL